MKLRAKAFRQDVSKEELAKLFEPESAQLFATSTAAHCKKCGAQFDVFLCQSDDPENPKHLGKLEEMISGDCNEGKHSRDYAFQTHP